MWILIRTAVTLGACGIVVEKAGFVRLASMAATLQARWLIAGLLLTLLQIALSGKRWQRLYGALVGSPPPLSRFVELTGKSLLYGQLLPSSVGVDLIRAGALARDCTLQGAARSVLCDRLVGLFVLLAIVAATLPFFAGAAGVALPVITLVAYSSAAILSCACFVFARKWLMRIPLVGRSLGVLASDMNLIAASRSTGPAVIAMSTAIHLLAVTAFAALLLSTGAKPQLFACAVVLPTALFLASIPISLGGWGVREAAIATGFSVTGGDPVAAATASLLLGLTGPIAGLLIVALSAIACSRRSHANPI